MAEDALSPAAKQAEAAREARLREMDGADAVPQWAELGERFSGVV